MSGPVPCSWCGVEVEADDGFRVGEPLTERRAAFCRLEHIVPWVISGAHWEPGSILEPGEDGDGLGRCAWCGGVLDEGHILVVRHRGEHRIGDAFCRSDHLLEWAKAGGRWR
jgi:hypothetical protein